MGCGTIAHVGRPEDALAQCDEVLRLDPTQPVAFDARMMALSLLGRHAEYIAAEAARARALGDPQVADTLERDFAEGGFEHAMRRQAETLPARAEQGGFASSSRIGLAFMHAGDIDAALDWLERAEEAWDPSMPYIAAGNAGPEELLSHPRYLAIRERMGLTEGR